MPGLLYRAKIKVSNIHGGVENERFYCSRINSIQIAGLGIIDVSPAVQHKDSEVQ